MVVREQAGDLAFVASFGLVGLWWRVPLQTNALDALGSSGTRVLKPGKGACGVARTTISGSVRSDRSQLVDLARESGCMGGTQGNLVRYSVGSRFANAVTQQKL